MRTLIALLLLLAAFPAPASSEELMVRMRNSDGGYVILTGARCDKTPKNSSFGKAMATNKKGEVVITGCWAPFGDDVVVIYEDRDVHLYPFYRFAP